MTRTCIYMDNHATTPVHPRVLQRMLPYFSEHFGNASSRTHAYGWDAESAVDQARACVARLLGASKNDVVFTSGATEANTLALWGVAMSLQHKGKHVVTQVTEHKAVLDVCRVLQQKGFEITYVPVDACGRVCVEALANAVRKDTVLVSVMAANNEIGTLQPLQEIGRVCAEKDVLFHTDAAQAAGCVPLNMLKQGLDLVSVSGHKMNGPKGVGALVVKKTALEKPLVPVMWGGGHEGGVRPGTLNVPGIVGLGEACVLAYERITQQVQDVKLMRDMLQTLLLDSLEGVHINGCAEARLPGNLHVSFDGVEGEALILALRDVAVSGGAACSSAFLEPSHVMQALGIAPERAKSSVRFGVGVMNTEEEIKEVAQRVVEKVHSLRQKRR
jgi:cysteine desulfurase